MSRVLVLPFALALVAAGAPPAAAGPGPLTLASGDKIVFAGATLLERDRHHGWIETALRVAFPRAELSVRNMSWPGDTTTVQLRPLGFGDFAAKLPEQNPTHVFLLYGRNEARGGEAGLPEFLDGYRKLLDVVDAAGAEAVLISPTPHERAASLAAPAVVTDHNANLERYTAAIRGLAEERGLRFVDLFHPFAEEFDAAGPADAALTENGIHLTDAGYKAIAGQIAAQLFENPPGVLFTAADADDYVALARRASAKDLEFFHRWRAHNSEYIYGRRASSSTDYDPDADAGNAGNPTFPAEFAELDRILGEADGELDDLAAATADE